MPASTCVNWLFGRGLSISSNLNWTVPQEWRALPRDEQIGRIESAVLGAMNAPTIDRTVIRRYLELLASSTRSPWRSRFITTNWDYLLQQEILGLNLEVQPSWMDNSHVFHLNGTVEVLPDNSQRSAFVLEEDPANKRVSTTEANMAWDKMLWNRTFVVVGMSFECEADKFLLASLGRVEDEMPIGESRWIVVNPNGNALTSSVDRIRHKLPRASVIGVPQAFSAWLEDGLPELRSLGVLT